MLQSCRTCRREFKSADAYFCPYCGTRIASNTVESDLSDSNDSDEFVATTVIPSHLLDRSIGADSIDSEPNMSSIWDIPRRARTGKAWLVVGALGLVVSTWFVARASVEETGNPTPVAADNADPHGLSQPGTQPVASTTAEPVVQARTSDIKARASRKTARRNKRSKRRASRKSSTSRHHEPETALKRDVKRSPAAAEKITDSTAQQVESAVAALTTSGPDIVSMPPESPTNNPPERDGSARSDSSMDDRRSFTQSTDDEAQPTTPPAIADEPTSTDSALIPLDVEPAAEDASTQDSHEGPPAAVPALEPESNVESKAALATAAHKQANENAARVDFFNKLGQAQLSKGNYAGANMSFARALSLDPDNQTALNGLRSAKKATGSNTQ